MHRRVRLVVALSSVLVAVSGGEVVRGGVVSATNSTIGLFDESSGTRDVTITGDQPGYASGVITQVSIAINFAKADGEEFELPVTDGTPFYDEIRFILTSPSQTSVTLIHLGSWNIGSGRFDGTIVFDDNATDVVNYTDAPQIGVFRPTGPGSLSDFDGELAAGTWSLFIQDTVGYDALRFREYTLNIATSGLTGAAPEPASLMLLGIGGLGWFVGAQHRWRRKSATG